MATAAAGWYCSHATEIVAETNTSKTIRVKCYWQNNGHNYNINYVYGYVYCIIDGEKNKQEIFTNGNVNTTSSSSAKLGQYDFVVPKGTSAKSVECYAKITSESSYVSGTKYSDSTFVDVGAKPTHTITYDATGGTGAPATQTKWYGESITLSSTKPTKTGHTFVNWCTNTSNTGTKYNPGDTYSSNANLTLYAIWSANTYTVTYNANGGTGAPANQTKTYGVDLTLSSTKPTKTNYNFLGWSTSANGGVVYSAGGKYTNNSAVTLYAVWELAYIKPRITNFTAQRCTSDGTTSDSGTYIKVTFGWATDKTVTGIKIEWKTQTGTTWSSTTVTASGTSGSVSQVIGAGAISTDSSYMVKATVSDSGGSTPSPTASIGSQKYPIDVKAKGTGVAIGKAAENDDELDVNWWSRFRKGLTALTKSMFEQGTSVKKLDGNAGTSGYMLACRITINQNHANQYILFGVTQRSRRGEIALMFASVDNKDPGISVFNKSGDIAAYIVKNTTSVWDLYIAKSEAWDEIEITELHKGGYMGSVSIQWINTVSSSLPSDYTAAGGNHSIHDGSFNVSSDVSTNGYKQYGTMILRKTGGNTILSAQNGGNIYIRPNGDTSDTGRFLFKSDGTLTAFGGSTRIYGVATLYNNTSGTDGTVTLSDSAANYDYLEIFYGKGTDTTNHKSEKIHAPNGKHVSLITGYTSSSTLSLLYFKGVNISGTSITVSTHGRTSIDGSGGTAIAQTTNYIKIYKVLGYK